ncbi:Gfo/Idh/MocA family oxidoreductase [Nocardioides sp. TF02-7]|uniref:Gfo/Idh/MocA family protein n=1 Tax=Nocardioides sp. TF02-7 TaxID=2917724 RepID=UPI001F064A2F|nr:Gfo/Idh/MocA family oxidoreductase [Nocardioides sp. TF02-7]UMG93472.1 Gfo/Idh/MocA family oxidoreductase [Nocardioides sp. TF02-7]
MTDTVRWGILAPGAIAGLLARDLALVPDAAITAVASRDRTRAEAFAAAHAPGARAYGDYAALVADPEVDVVYVASPHALHLEQATLALAGGKHVLCEKPLTLDRGTAEALVAVARAHDRFLMEAMWSACHPVWRDLARRLRAGDFGTPRQLAADLSFVADVGPDHRLRNPALGGGALLDIGVYPLTFAHVLLGEALELRATGVLDTRDAAPGVDLDVAIAGRYPGEPEVVAALRTSLTSHSPCTATIATDEGWVEVPTEFHFPSHFTFHPRDPRRGADGGTAEPVRFDPPEPVVGTGYGNEVAHVGDCLRRGLRESPLVPHAQTLTVLGQIDDLRRQLGTHPGLTAG